MDEYESLNHTKWECKYHVVFIPKCRRKVLYTELRRYLGEIFRRLAEQKECRIEEGHLLPGHVHMMIAIPPKYAVSQASDRVHQGEERDPSGAGVRGAEAEFCGAALLGTRVLRVHSGQERGSGTRVHSKAGARRPAIGPDGAVVRGHRTVAAAGRCRVSDAA
jgi:transposase IS200 family protein